MISRCQIALQKLELHEKLLKPVGFHMCFLFKVYLILASQLLVTAGIVAVFTFV